MTDPFQALSLSPRFDLADADIERAYLGKIASAHPDAASQAEAADPATLNDARRALLDPEQRAEALLAVLGGPGPGSDRELPDGFLHEMLDVRMQLEDAQASDDPAEREQWRAWASERRDQHIAAVAQHFSDYANNPQPEKLVAVRRELNAWRYAERMLEQIDPAAGPGLE
ncbi:MAG: iron-sulfur cluster co-chaperone HscB C-terminal domain-containing protein [Planctomycetota bacterium]